MRAAERRRKTKVAQKSQKKIEEIFDFFFCDFCETFAPSAFCPRIQCLCRPAISAITSRKIALPVEAARSSTWLWL